MKQISSKLVVCILNSGTLKIFVVELKAKFSESTE